MDIQRFLATHDGVITRAQARACGLSDDQIARKVASGEWIRRAPGVYFAIAWAWTVTARVRVAGEWARPTGALGATAAAWWLGLGVTDPRPLTVILPRGCSRKSPRGVTVVQRDLRGDRVEHRGLPVVGRALATLDTAVALGPEGQTFLDRALQQGQVTLEDLRAAQSRHLGRRGSAAAHRLLVRAGDRAASEPERLVAALLRRAGVTGWTLNHEVTLSTGRRALLDIAFPDVRFAIEVDGWAFHVDPERFVGDRVRKRTLVADGWTVVEVTWDDLLNRPDEVIDQVRRVLARLRA
ncbi:type IV toxin-antitoxin system AbiEi family antitoxin domain-containing protein [Actinomycetospora sp. TBRC 11914]|uniref:type IV toxin-antitoxin system AbiEi family antitoxin domain-containing protein n=1 Tax=Actinomycetospora sp. TBRC 11914 TaxID=2729387 RepID=UPI00145F3CBF|nr:type IV toxin-antitoxin system AbiEi family antitoxin domain-containing protein [Actinomycetospora sp. TBRC 11914]NMO89017.1 DUF559 domain-containing protein [Actinomycetospora sp. TBRC 11914]